MNKNMYTDLSEIEGQFKMIMNLAGDAVIIFDGKGTILEVNSHACRLFGYTDEEYRSLTLMDLETEEYSLEDLQVVWGDLQRDKPKKSETHYTKKNGEKITVEVTQCILDRNGKSARYIALVRDISEQKRLERLSEDVNMMMRHDIKTPLNTVINIPRIIRESGNLNEEQLEMLDLLEKSGHRILNLVDMSLGLYKMETGTYDFRPDRIDVAVIVTNIYDELSSLAEIRNVRLELYYNDIPSGGYDSMIVKGEDLLTYSMLANIIKNAIEASSDGQRVRVTLSSDKNIVTVHNETSVPLEVRNTFFDKFSTAGKKSGTGLGTYSAQLIAQTQGGTIAMKTSDVEGTLLTITFMNG